MTAPNLTLSLADKVDSTAFKTVARWVSSSVGSLICLLVGSTSLVCTGDRGKSIKSSATSVKALVECVCAFIMQICLVSLSSLHFVDNRIYRHQFGPWGSGRPSYSCLTDPSSSLNRQMQTSAINQIQFIVSFSPSPSLWASAFSSSLPWQMHQILGLFTLSQVCLANDIIASLWFSAIAIWAFVFDAAGASCAAPLGRQCYKM